MGWLNKTSQQVNAERAAKHQEEADKKAKSGNPAKVASSFGNAAAAARYRQKAQGKRR